MLTSCLCEDKGICVAAASQAGRLFNNKVIIKLICYISGIVLSSHRKCWLSYLVVDIQLLSCRF